MLHSSFRSTGKKGKTFWFDVVPLIDIFNFYDTEIGDIVSRTVDYKLVVNWKVPDRSEVKRPNTNNTNITETLTRLSKLRRQKIAKLTAK